MLFGAITLAFNQSRGSRQLWLSDSRTFHLMHGITESSAEWTAGPTGPLPGGAPRIRRLDPGGPCQRREELEELGGRSHSEHPVGLVYGLV